MRVNFNIYDYVYACEYFKSVYTGFLITNGIDFTAYNSTGYDWTAYTSNLSLLASQIEDNLNELLGEEVMKWESTVGIFGGGNKDFMVKRLGKAWLTTSLFGIAIVAALNVSTLWYGFGPFYDKVGNIAWIFLLFDIAIIVGGIVIGYRLITGSWKKIKKIRIAD